MGEGEEVMLWRVSVSLFWRARGERSIFAGVYSVLLRKSVEVSQFHIAGSHL